jgi:hypothetical protein
MKNVTLCGVLVEDCIKWVKRGRREVEEEDSKETVLAEFQGNVRQQFI